MADGLLLHWQNGLSLVHDYTLLFIPMTITVWLLVISVWLLRRLYREYGS
ncbi:hypothetical protein PB1E_1758 [Leuconostoc gelidum subsp. gasicomitatum]|nr:hypothetical protein PB1E_1758 [Leuconostoc gasicomitatum]